MKTAAANVRTAWATIRLTTFGRMWRRMMWPGPLPMTRARSTNIRSLIESVCERMIRAVVAQLRDADDDDDDEQGRPDARGSRRRRR